MKIGVCTNFLNRETYSLREEQFPLLGELFDYIELPAMTVAAMEEDEFAAFRDRCAGRYSLPVMTNLLPGSMRVMEPGFDRAELKAYLDGLLPRCEALGCRTLVFGSGKARSTLPGQSREEGYRLLAELMDEYILPACAERRIRVLIEPLNPSICNFILSLEEGRILQEACRRPLYLLADSLHLMGQPSFAAELRANIASVAHVHLSEADRKNPAAGLSEPLAAFLSALKEAGYQGDMSLECLMETEYEMRASLDRIRAVWERGQGEGA